MADITQLRFAQLLKRLFGVKTSDPGRALMPGVIATAEVNDTYQPENRASRGEKLFGVLNNLSNIAATSFGLNVFIMPSGTNRIAVIRRATLSVLLPTAANQPGSLFFGARIPQPGSQSILVQCQAKDARFNIQSGGNTNLACGISNATAGILGWTNSTLHAVQLFPGAAAVPTIYVIDNLDIPVPPGFQVTFALAADALPVATYTYTLCLEGYERALDPNETLPPGL